MGVNIVGNIISAAKRCNYPGRSRVTRLRNLFLQRVPTRSGLRVRVKFSLGVRVSGMIRVRVDVDVRVRVSNLLGSD